MSEQEKTTGGTGASGPPVVMVESGARHKQPYRPTELQDEALPDMHHKRSRAPAVPSVAEELKAATETSATKERKESERAMSSDKHKSNAAKKLSNTKRRGSSPETITLAPLEVETKRASLTPPPQPIPAQVESMVSMASDATGKFGEEKRDDDDSIKEEIAELRTPVVAKPSSEWRNSQELDLGDKTIENVAEEDMNEEGTKKEGPDDENIPLQEGIIHLQEDKTNILQEKKDGPPKFGTIALREDKEDSLKFEITEHQEEKDRLAENKNIPLQEEKEDVPTFENIVLQEEKDQLAQHENISLEELVVVAASGAGSQLNEKKLLLGVKFIPEIKELDYKNVVDDIRVKKKEISWNDKGYLQTVNLQEMGHVRSYAWTVERKASIGPYFQSTSSLGGPSGITICIPKKSRKGINEDLNIMPSVINITVSKKNLGNRFVPRSKEGGKDNFNLKIGDAPNATFFGVLRGKINGIRHKIKNTLNI